MQEQRKEALPQQRRKDGCSLSVGLVGCGAQVSSECYLLASGLVAAVATVPRLLVPVDFVIEAGSISVIVEMLGTLWCKLHMTLYWS